MAPISKTPLRIPCSGKENKKQFLENQEGKLWLSSVSNPGPILGGEGEGGNEIQPEFRNIAPANWVVPIKVQSDTVTSQYLYWLY